MAQSEKTEVLNGALLDEVALTLEQMAHACAVEPDWVVQRVRRGILLDGLAQQVEHQLDEQLAVWRFASADLRRARSLVCIERDFDADQDLAALVVDLCEEVGRLKTMLRNAGHR